MNERSFGGRSRTYLGLGLVALTTLSIQIALTRLLSYVTWYHLAFFAISTCMLGMTAGAVSAYVRPDPRPERLARDCLYYGLLAALAVAVLCLLPIERGSANFAAVTMLLMMTVLLAAPFYFAGRVIAQVLAMPEFPSGRLYAADLGGAALGCLFVLAAMSTLDVPSLLVLCAGMAAATGAVFHRKARMPLLVGGLLSALALANGLMADPIFRAQYVKGGKAPNVAAELISRWNSFSHVVALKPVLGQPAYWGEAPRAPYHGPVEAIWFFIDGMAGTPMFRSDRNADLSFLQYDVTNVAHFIRPRGPVAVIGVGGGRDVQSALLFGHEHVTAIEVNPIIVDAHRKQFASYAGVAGNPAVNLVNDDGRSYLSRTAERFSVIQMSMVDTWAATGAGAFSLSENGLYTVEAWRMFLQRLSGNGVLTVSRWHNPDNLGETGRVLSVAMQALFELGVQKPALHLAMITTGNISSLIVARQPLTDGDIGMLAAQAERLGYVVAVLPDRPAAHPLLNGLLNAGDAAELQRVALASHSVYNLVPSTDDSPFFFNMLKAGAVISAIQVAEMGDASSGVIVGNLLAERTLVVLIATSLALALLTIIGPLLAAGRARTLREPGFLSAAILFSSIGLGFMFVEISLMQRLSAFLGRPAYALAILLFAIILSTGAGSLLSDRLSSATARRLAWLASPAIALLPAALGAVIGQLEAASMPVRIAASIALILPFGLLMGLFFPTGIRLSRAAGFGDTAWFWALNGVCGTVASGGAVYISIHFGISTTLWCASACYVVAAAALWKIGSVNLPDTPATRTAA
jgi:hypothetical protein